MSHLPLPLRRIRLLLACTLVLAGLLGLLWPSGVGAQPADAQPEVDDLPSTRVDVLPLTGAIDRAVVSGIRWVLDTAAADGVDLVVLQLDTPGALAVDDEEVLGALADSPVPVAVYAGPGLVEAQVEGLGVLMLLAADIAAMAPDATIGPALPVDLADDTDAGRHVLEHAVSARDEPDTERVADLLATTRLDATAALDAGLVDLVADGVETLLVDLDGTEVTTAGGQTRTLELGSGDDVGVRFTTIGLVRRVLHASSTPTLLYLTLLVGVALLLFELFQPGFGVAGFAAAVLLPIAGYGVMVLPVAWWAALLLVLGLALLAGDVAVAGLGIPTAAGTLAIVLGSMNLFPSPHLGIAGWLIAFMTVSALVFFVVIMTIVLRAQAGPDREAVAALVGEVGVVRSVLNPEGHVFIDEALWRSRWTGEGKLTVGTTVEVVGVDGAVLLVDRVATPTVPHDAAGRSSST
jgi:membrane-bound serine protease (ClpP class)